MHFKGCKIIQDVRHIFQFLPVILDILARAEIPVTLVIFSGNMGEGAHLLRREQTISNGDPQHIGMVDAAKDEKALFLLLDPEFEEHEPIPRREYKSVRYGE